MRMRTISHSRMCVRLRYCPLAHVLALSMLALDRAMLALDRSHTCRQCRLLAHVSDVRWLHRSHWLVSQSLFCSFCVCVTRFLSCPCLDAMLITYGLACVLWHSYLTKLRSCLLWLARTHNIYSYLSIECDAMSLAHLLQLPALSYHAHYIMGRTHICALIPAHSYLFALLNGMGSLISYTLLSALD